MKKNLFLMIAVLAASPVMGQDAKQIAEMCIRDRPCMPTGI